MWLTSNTALQVLKYKLKIIIQSLLHKSPLCQLFDVGVASQLASFPANTL
jgi:hypothetical protein